MVTQNCRLHPRVGSSHLARASRTSIPSGKIPLRPISLDRVRKSDTFDWVKLNSALLIPNPTPCSPDELELGSE